MWFCNPRICGLRGDSISYICILWINGTSDQIVDRGSNACVTGDLGILLIVIDINLIVLSVTLDSAPSSTNDCTTKHGLLPLTLSDGSIYYQRCFYCANLVEAIISPAAFLASSNVFV